MYKIKFINYNNRSYIGSLELVRYIYIWRMCERRERRGGSRASGINKEQLASVSSGADVLRERVQRSKRHTKLRGALKNGVALGKVAEHVQR